MIIPQNGDVLIKPIKREKEKTNSGIFLTGAGKEMQEESLRYGEIIHSGSSIDYKRRGQKVFYSAYSGSWVADDDGEYQLISYLDIRATEEDTDPYDSKKV